MKIAWRELVRRPSRFVTAAGILTLIALLLMFLGGLADGLIARSTDAIAAQRGQVIVYSRTARHSFVRSRITATSRRQIASVPGVAATGGIGVAELGARVPGNGPRDLANVALFGYEIAPHGVPSTPADGEAYADSTLRAKGVRAGQTILVGPARTPIRIIGMVDNTSYSGEGSLWASLATWASVLQANRPQERLAPGAVQALIVQTRGSAGAVARAIDAATGGNSESLTIAQAIDAVPGVTAQRSTFATIIDVTAVIALVVVGLFFTLLTIERVALYGVLKAIGARSRTLFAGVVLQAVVVTLVAAVVAGGLGLIMDRAIPADAIPYHLGAARLVSSVGLLLVAAIVGSAFSLRRVLKIDPASAIGSSQ
jgi:putative ABC transport system permease protein